MEESSQPTAFFSKAIDKLKKLPVAEKVGAVMETVQSGKIAILTAETGSGKTLLANSVLADASDHQVLVLVPRRFLAVNAAETVAFLAGVEVGGKEVGYAYGKQGCDGAKFIHEDAGVPGTKLVFSTYGYALSSGMLKTAKTIVFDEVHEASMDISLARAIIRKRLETDKDLKLVEMSATLNAPKQAAYWDGVDEAKGMTPVRATDIIRAPGNPIDCDYRPILPKDKSIAEIARGLIDNDGRKGIAIFLPGVPEVEAQAKLLTEYFRDAGKTNIEIATIYGDMDEEDRKKALSKPEKEGNVKILIGTNVIESGMNIDWLDAGISDGKCKIPYFNEQTGAVALRKEELPKWRIIQQEGRVKRFKPGVFVLHSELDKDSRDLEKPPEITRVSLVPLVMQAANYGINPAELKYDAEVTPERLGSAKKYLERLKLINTGDDWTLTDKGKYVASLPLEVDAATMIWAAEHAVVHPKSKTGIHNDAIDLAAVVDVGSLRDDYKIPHKQDQSSDMLDALGAFRKIRAYEREKTLEHAGNTETIKELTKIECALNNVSWLRYKQVKETVEELHHRLGKPEKEDREATRDEMIQIILHGHVNKLYDKPNGFRDLGRDLDKYEANENTAVKEHQPFAVGQLVEFPGGSGGGAMTVLTDLTAVDKDNFVRFAASYPGLLTDLGFSPAGSNNHDLTGKYFGGAQVDLRIPKTMAPNSMDSRDPLSRLIDPQAFWDYLNTIGGKSTKGIGKRPEGRANTVVEEIQTRQLKRG